jgi:redox-sensing transcriptional repressor
MTGRSSAPSPNQILAPSGGWDDERRRRRVARARRRTAHGGHVPDATVSRLPGYLRALATLAGLDVVTVSSDELAGRSGVSPAQLRKDLSYLGSYGRRGVGYDVQALRDRIEEHIGLTRCWPVVVVGAGKLGQALAGYSGLLERGFAVVALLDVDPVKVGATVAGHPVRHVDELDAVLAAVESPCLGVVATPGEVAQQVADLLVACGIRSVLSFAPAPLEVPAGVDVRQVDLAVELQILAFHEQHRTPTTPSDREQPVLRRPRAVAG